MYLWIVNILKPEHMIIMVGKIPWRRGMATHSSILAWRILRTEEPGELQTTVSQRVGHDGATYTL